MGKLFWVAMGFFILGLAMFAGQAVVEMLKYYLRRDPLHNSELDKNNRKLRYLKLEKWENSWAGLATGAGCLGMLTCLVGTIVSLFK